MDNYYRFDPEYSAMSDAERDAFVARYNMNQGGIARLNLRRGSGDELPPDPTTPVNPFKPKPIGPVLPNKIASAILGDESDALAEQLFGKPVKDLNPAEMQELQDEIDRLMNKFRAEGILSFEEYLQGKQKFMKEQSLEDMIREYEEYLERMSMKRDMVAKGGVMSVPVRTNSEGVKELDYRKTGGFVPIGVKEKADDVPAMLSKNEFVFTADAVRGAGDGSVKKGAQRMYDTMKKLESRVG